MFVCPYIYPIGTVCGKVKEFQKNQKKSRTSFSALIHQERIGVFLGVQNGAVVDVVPEVTAEHTVTGPWGHIGVRFPFLVAEDHVARTFDVERAVRALDNTAFGNVGRTLGVDAVSLSGHSIAGVGGLGGFGGGLFSRLRSASLLRSLGRGLLLGDHGRRPAAPPFSLRRQVSDVCPVPPQ